ncbi:MAG: thioredoxin fold domain-containing protein, partial [Candidatus Zixiibacteriota bacterium]
HLRHATLTAAAVLLFSACLLSAGAQAVSFTRYNDFTEAQAAAKKTGLPILIDFYTDWCKYCKQMDTITFKDPAVVEWINRNVIFARVNSDNESGSRTEFAESYGVRGYPTFALVKADGADIDRAVGFLDASRFIQTFTDYRNDRNTLGDYLRRLEETPSAKLHYDIAEKYRWRARSKEAEAHFAQAIDLDKNNETGIKVDSRWSLADLARRDGNYDLAIERYKSVIGAFPEHEYVPDAHLYIGLCLRDKGELQMAVERFELFKELFPENEDFAYADKKIKQIKEDLKTKAP